MPESARRISSCTLYSFYRETELLTTLDLLLYCHHPLQCEELIVKLYQSDHMLVGKPLFNHCDYTYMTGSKRALCSSSALPCMLIH